jgi:hypothetical protein
VTVFWVVAPCSLVEVYRCFRGPCYLHHQSDDGASSPWWWRQQAPLKRRVNFYQATRCNNPEDSHLHILRRENHKSHRITFCSAHITFKLYLLLLTIESLNLSLGVCCYNKLLFLLTFQLSCLSLFIIVISLFFATTIIWWISSREQRMKFGPPSSGQNCG